jgi:hypothetical protein
VDTYSPGSSYFDIAILDVSNTGYTKRNYDAMIPIAGGEPIATGEGQLLPTASRLARRAADLHVAGGERDPPRRTAGGPFGRAEPRNAWRERLALPLQTRWA